LKFQLNLATPTNLVVRPETELARSCANNCKRQCGISLKWYDSSCKVRRGKANLLKSKVRTSKVCKDAKDKNDKAAYDRARCPSWDVLKNHGKCKGWDYSGKMPSWCYQGKVSCPCGDKSGQKIDEQQAMERIVGQIATMGVENKIAYAMKRGLRNWAMNIFAKMTFATVKMYKCWMATCSAEHKDTKTPKTSCNEALRGYKASGYRGCQGRTVSGRTCQAWASQSPHKHGMTKQRYPKAGLTNNYCRNPDGERSIWCYTTDPKKRWEWCKPKGAGDEEAGDIDLEDLMLQDVKTTAHDISLQDLETMTDEKFGGGSYC